MPLREGQGRVDRSICRGQPGTTGTEAVCRYRRPSDTVNCNFKAIVDFQDGGWYDITASPEYLRKLDPTEAKTKYDGKANSAQPIPDKQELRYDSADR